MSSATASTYVWEDIVNEHLMFTVDTRRNMVFVSFHGKVTKKEFRNTITTEIYNELRTKIITELVGPEYL